VPSAPDLAFEILVQPQAVPSALQQAQLEMRAKVKSAHAGQDLPYYWRAFVIVGR
jgi:CHAT domain-containing protein